MPPETGQTQRLLIVNANGKPRTCLDATYGLRLLGEDGSRPHASLGVLTTGQPALLFLYGPMPRVELRLDEQGNSDFTMVGNRQLEVAELCIRAGDNEEQQDKKAKRRQPTAAKKGV